MKLRWKHFWSHLCRHFSLNGKNEIRTILKIAPSSTAPSDNSCTPVFMSKLTNLLKHVTSSNFWRIGGTCRQFRISSKMKCCWKSYDITHIRWVIPVQKSSDIFKIHCRQRFVDFHKFHLNLNLSKLIELKAFVRPTHMTLVRGALIPFYNNFAVEHHAPSMRQAIKEY